MEALLKLFIQLTVLAFRVGMQVTSLLLSLISQGLAALQRRQTTPRYTQKHRERRR